jgi:two-component system response regulator YesN
MTLTDYIINIRIEKAKELLYEKKLAVKEIASSFGFNDPDYFSRV